MANGDKQPEDPPPGETSPWLRGVESSEMQVDPPAYDSAESEERNAAASAPPPLHFYRNPPPAHTQSERAPLVPLTFFDRRIRLLDVALAVLFAVVGFAAV